MQTDFFRKKIYFVILASLLALFITLTAIYAAFLSQAESLWLGKSFYFLVSNTEHVEAGAYDVQLSGGAGYLLDHNERAYVALAVYLKEEEGISVQGGMDHTTLLQINVDKLYFKTLKQKKNKPLYQGALDCLYGCMEVLGLEIKRLDNGATQQSSMHTLSILLKQLCYLAKAYREDFSACADVCKYASEQLDALLSNIIYVKDLRYLLCDLTSGYIQLASHFSL